MALSQRCVGQNILSLSPGARGAALANVKTVHRDVLAVLGNQAGLAHVEQVQVSLSTERRFNQSGLNYYALAAAYPSTWGTFGLTIQHFGFDAFNEKLLGLAYGRRLGEALSIGAQFDYLQVRIPGYGKNSTMTAELGLLARLTSEVQMGFHVYNIFESQWVQEELLPSTFGLGVRYEPTDKVLVVGEVEKVSDFGENFKVGLGYRLHPQLEVCVGFTTRPSLVTFGVGYRMLDGFSLDVASTVHSALGVSPIGSITYKAKQ